MLHNVPIESLEERYSAQWNVGFPHEFARLGVRFRTLYPGTAGIAEQPISNGQFLDVVRTNGFKALQLQMLVDLVIRKELKENDVVFLHDLWFPGLEMLFYIRDGLGLKFKIAGLLHAGTYDPWDFLTQKGMGRWARYLENAWFGEVDAIFVATEYHKRLLLEHRLTFPEQIHVTGFPLFQEPVDLNNSVKENIVVFPHRLAPEKNPQGFQQLEAMCREELPDWKFLATKHHCHSKQDYYALLERSKIAVSCAFQETFGIAQQEALFLGCIPVVPNRLSYSELYDLEFRYDNLDEAATVIVNIANNWNHWRQAIFLHSTVRRCHRRSEKAIANMVNVMRNRGWAV